MTEVQEEAGTVNAAPAGPAPATPAPPVPVSQGTYALFQTPAGGLHLVYRAKGADQDTHMEIPAFVVSMASRAAAGGGSTADLMTMLGGML